eukprot:NODE_106_length_19857_cov_0.799980.p6 type:complete len:410 gc:universal NODE_106_length_19857_cov_0.799980:7552-8781(+)
MTLTQSQIREFVDSHFSLQIGDKISSKLYNLLQLKLHEDGIDQLKPHSKESYHLIAVINSIDFTESMPSICEKVMKIKFEKPLRLSKLKSMSVLPSLGANEEFKTPEYYHNYLEHLLVKYAVYKDRRVKEFETIADYSVIINEPVQEKQIEIVEIKKEQEQLKTSIQGAFDEIKNFTEEVFFKWAQKTIATMNEDEIKSFLSILFNSFPKQQLLLPYLRRTGEVQWKDEKLYDFIFRMKDDSGLQKFQKEMTKGRLSITTKKLKNGKFAVNTKSPVPFDDTLYAHLSSCLLSNQQLIELSHSLHTLDVPKSELLSYILKIGLSLEVESYDLCIRLLSKLSICKSKYKVADKKLKFYEGGLKKQRLFGNSKNLMKESNDRRKIEKLHQHLTFELGHLKKELFESYNLSID